MPATVELLETLGVPVIGYRTDTLPLFYDAAGGPPVSGTGRRAGEIARIADAHWRLGGNTLLVGRPPTESLDVEPLIEEAVAAAEREEISGQAVTPFVLAYLHEHSGGETRRVNRDLIVANAGPRRRDRRRLRESLTGAACESLRRRPRSSRSPSRATPSRVSNSTSRAASCARRR